MVGESDAWVREHGGRRELFDIADDEQLIGCELKKTESYFCGLTWKKMKVLRVSKQETKG